jgi:hypothetical protein
MQIGYTTDFPYVTTKTVPRFRSLGQTLAVQICFRKIYHFRRDLPKEVSCFQGWWRILILKFMSFYSDSFSPGKSNMLIKLPMAGWLAGR